MLKPNSDYTFIGSSYLSYICGIELLSQGKSVLLVDDERMKYGNYFLTSLGELERSFLQIWGELSNITALKNLDLYLKRDTILYHFNDKQIRFGRTPSKNLIEWARKLPTCFLGDENVFEAFRKCYDAQEKFDAEFMSYIKKVAMRVILSNQKKKKITLATFQNECPEIIKKLFNSFKKTLKHESELNSEHRTFLYISRSFFHGQLSFSCTDIELFHIILRILGPAYELNQQSLDEDLRKEFIDLSGRLKETGVSEFLFHKQKPWSLQLDSYEGVVMPKNLLLFGGSLRKVNFSVEDEADDELYSSFELVFETKRELNPGWRYNKVVMACKEKIGSKIPIVIIVPEKNRIVATLFYKHQEGMKPSFVRRELNLYLSTLFSEISDLSSTDFTLVDVSESLDLWKRKRGEDKEDNKKQKSIVHELKTVSWDDNNSQQVLKNVHYFGPFNKAPFGALSNQLNIQRFVHENCT